MIEKPTGKMINAGGIPISIPNDIISSNKDFYISYNNRDIRIYGDVTTALVYEYPKGISEHYYILKGNHSKQYKNIIDNGGDIKECLEYFKSNHNLISEYSDQVERIKSND